jgi:hypothetical protein
VGSAAITNKVSEPWPVTCLSFKTNADARCRQQSTLFITSGARGVTNTPSFTGCPTIATSNKRIPSFSI